MEDTFSRFGNVTEVSIIRKKKPTTPSGFAFVSFQELSSAISAFNSQNTITFFDTFTRKEFDFLFHSYIP